MWVIFVEITTDCDGDLLKSVNITSALLIALATLPLASSFAVAGANVYQWTDERGNQVNSDRPPPAGIKYEVISTQSSLVREVDEEEGAVPPVVKPSPANQFEPVDTAKPAVPEKNPEYCKVAKDNLFLLDTQPRVRMPNAQGEMRILNEEERAAERDKAMAAIESYCE